MEQLRGGATSFHHRHHRSPPSAERFLGVLPPEKSSSAAPQFELSEHDIFSTPSGDSSPSPTHRNSKPYSSPTRNDFGILAALNGNLNTWSRSGSETRPVFNHRAAGTAASLSSSAASSASPAASTSSRIMIPRPPPRRQAADSVRFHHQSAPVNVPAMPAAVRMRARGLGDVASDEEEDGNGVVLPPHEVVAARHSPMLACSVLEGAGRTLKGRDLRQVRNAIWRKTGFID